VNGLTWQQGGTGIMVAGIAVIAVILIAVAARWWRDGGQQLERARKHAAIDQAARTPVTRPLSLGDLVISPQQEEAVRQRLEEAYLRRYPADTRADLPTVRCAWCWPADGDEVPAPGDCPCKTDCGSVACIAPLRTEGFPS
jgi:hypothetical protein